MAIAPTATIADPNKIRPIRYPWARAYYRAGIGEQFEYIMRDESLHLAFGCDLIRTLREECPGAWTPDFEREIVDLVAKAVDFERRYALDACPEGLLGCAPSPSEPMSNTSPTAAWKGFRSRRFTASTTLSRGCRNPPTWRRRRTSSKPASPKTAPAAR